MRKILICLLLLSSSLFAAPISYTIVKNPYYFTTYFEMIDESGYMGRAIKPSVSAHSYYELYNAESEFQGQGVCRLLSAGTFYNWARSIDVYDACGASIGLIQGTVFSTAKAKYYLYNADGMHTLTALQNLNQSGFTITDPSGRVVGFIRHNRYRDEEWEVILYQKDLIDLSIIKVLSAFICDQFS